MCDCSTSTVGSNPSCCAVPRNRWPRNCRPRPRSSIGSISTKPSVMCTKPCAWPWTRRCATKLPARAWRVARSLFLKRCSSCARCAATCLVNDAALPARGSSSGKLDSLMEMLEELFAEGRRILLFSQFTSMLSLIEVELKKRGVAYALLTGQTRDRRTPVKDFQSGKLQIFLISLKAGGVGLNLTEADTVIHYDPWWNPATENQATDRAYRIGQEKPVFVYKLIARGTVEEKIQHLQKEKSDLAAGVLDGRSAGDWKLQSDDIEALFAPLPDKLEKR